MYIYIRGGWLWIRVPTNTERSIWISSSFGLYLASWGKPIELFTGDLFQRSGWRQKSPIWVPNVNMCNTGKGRVGERVEENGWLTLWWMLASCLGVVDLPAGLAGHRWMSRPTAVEQNDGDDAAEGWTSRWGKLADRLLSRLPLDRRRSPSRWALDLFWWPASAPYLASTVAHTPTRSGRWATQCHRQSPLQRNTKRFVWCLASFFGILYNAINRFLIVTQQVK